MRIMNRITAILAVAATAMAVSSCFSTSDCNCTSAEEDNGTESASFRISTRAEGGLSDLTRLYVAERTGEHDNDESLHCSLVADITEPSADGSGLVYSLTGMTAQWYKFAFVSVPDGVSYQGGSISGEQMLKYEGKESLPEGEDCDFSKVYIDFSPVLKAQKADSTLARTADLHIYRNIIDRWLLPDQTLSEDVTLQRITGQMVLDMGVLEDQFPHEIEYMTLTLSTAENVYLRDNAAGDVILLDGSYNDHVFRYDSFNWNKGEHFIARVNLLPGVVSNAYVTVKYAGTSESAVYPVMASSDEFISVKSNTRTIVRFNGIEDGLYEVRYAGFLEYGEGSLGAGAEVGVDNDVWDN